MAYSAIKDRYNQLQYRRCGNSGLQLPSITLGFWHNFGGSKLSNESKKIIFRAFDRGVTHFDLANNYGPPYGSAEENFGRLISSDLRPYRDELIISTKALDRVLLWNHYVIPQWHISSYRTLYWDIFDKPKIRPKYSLGTNTWWVDSLKASTIDERKKSIQ